jgi:hypothetical protein
MKVTIIQIIGFANNQPCPIAGEWVQEYDPAANDGVGFVKTTDDRSKAKRVDSVAEALKFYRQAPANKPRRSDGKPNRPLTCSHVQFEPYEVPDAPVRQDP